MQSGPSSEPRWGLFLSRLALGLFLFGATILILRPFLVPMVWAATVAFMTWGPYTRACRASGRPRAMALLFTLAVFLLLGVPTVWLLVLGINEAIELVGAGQAWVRAGTPLPAWLTESRWFGAIVERLLAQPLPGAGEVGPRLLEVGKALSQQLLRLAGGVAQNVFAFFVTVITLYVLYSDGERLAAHGRRLFAWLFPGQPAHYLDEVGGVIRAVVLGVLGTAAAQGGVAGVGYAIFGVPYAVGLSVLTAFLSFLPGGTFLTTAGSALWLFSQGRTGAAVGMALWGFLLVGTLDGWLRPLLISRSGTGNLPFLLILFGVLGGLAAFGLLGLLFGPVVLAVVFALLAELPPRAEAGELPAEASAAGAQRGA
jgi:predicted PurR-regulated permease PerM